MNKAIYFNSSLDVKVVSENWWAFVLQGIASLIFGSVAIFSPLEVLLIMTLFFGAYAIIDGIFSIILGIHDAHKGTAWRSFVLSGIISVGAGLIVLIQPQLSTVSLAFFLWTIAAIWSVSTGLAEICAALHLRSHLKDEWFLAISGLISVILGLCMFFIIFSDPLMSLITLGWLVGLNALMSGTVLLLLGVKLYRLKNAA